MARGKFPTRIAFPGLLVAVRIGVTVFETPITYAVTGAGRAGAEAVCAGRAAPAVVPAAAMMARPAIATTRYLKVTEAGCRPGPETRQIGLVMQPSSISTTRQNMSTTTQHVPGQVLNSWSAASG